MISYSKTEIYISPYILLKRLLNTGLRLIIVQTGEDTNRDLVHISTVDPRVTGVGRPRVLFRITIDPLLTDPSILTVSTSCRT